jgi:thiol-disulfide isomerase/thioredoxin
MRRFLFFPVWVALLWLSPVGSRARAAGPSIPKPTFNVYDEKIDRHALIAETVAKARASGKRTLLVFGSNDCGPCRKLHAMLHDRGPLGQIVAARYVIAHVTVNGVRDRDLEARYGNVKELGIPWLVVVGDDGRALKIQSTREFAKGNSRDGPQMLAFLREWAAPN